VIFLASGIIRDVEIKGIACAVPEQIVNNESYIDRFGEENVRKFIKMTGVKTRHVARDEQCTSDLCYVAAVRLLEKLGWKPETVDALILITQTPDYAIPATACVLQHRLGLSEDCLAFDINLGCSAYVYGVWIASSIISAGNINRVLLLVGDTSNFGINRDDSSTAMIFGDGGTATALERSPGKEMKFFLKTKGSHFRSIIVPAGHARNRNRITTKKDFGVNMDGSDVFAFSISDVPRSIREFFSEYGIDKDSIDLFVFHQANLFILKNLARKLDIPFEKVPVSLERYGNTSGESIPLTLVDALAQREEEPDGGGIPREKCVEDVTADSIKDGRKDDETLKLFLCGFGVGLSWGGVCLEMKRSACLPMIYTSDYFRGG